MKACLGLLTVELIIPESHSLKTRRSVLNSLKERVRNRYNVSISESDDNDKWQRAGFIISAAGPSPSHVDECLRSVTNFLDSDDRVQVTLSRIRFYE